MAERPQFVQCKACPAVLSRSNIDIAARVRQLVLDPRTTDADGGLRAAAMLAAGRLVGLCSVCFAQCIPEPVDAAAELA